MPAETRECQNCKKAFEIAPEDFEFYKKIEVPPPTFCPDCRNQRRLAWRNERSLYRGVCAATGKPMITMFASGTPHVVYERDHWWSDNWDQLASGREYDFSKPFLQQFSELLQAAPLPNLANTNLVNTDYANHVVDAKDCYLIFASFTAEDVSYSAGALSCKNSLDLYTCERIERCYEDTLCGGLNQVHFSHDSDDSLNCAFLYACKNMSDCFACANLRNRSHHIFNVPYSAEDYKKEVAAFDLGSYVKLQALKERFDVFSKQYPRRYASILKSVDVTGDYIMSSKNVRYCFDIYGNLENVKYVFHTIDLKDSYDGYGLGAGAELMYEGVDTGIEASRNKFNVFTHKCRDVDYTYSCFSSKSLFGCVGLRNKQYCILNKQYSKEEYETLVPKIIEHMHTMPYVDAAGRTYRYGEFFPIELSPFAYNETIAQEYYPLLKGETETLRFRWKDPDTKDYQITLQPDKLPDHISEAQDTILNEVIGCAHGGTCNHQCTSAFKLISTELQFYRTMNIALPRLCSNCRHYERIAKRTPFKLWKRDCQCAGTHSARNVYANTGTHTHGAAQCPNSFETAYAPEREEVVYCEQCFQAEVV